MDTFAVDKFGHPIYAVIPVDKRKRPLVRWQEYQKRLPSVEEKQAWIARFNGRIAGWAMPTGQVSGIIVLDFDGVKGVETMTNLGLKPNVRTAGGGYHVWIEAPDYAVRTGAIDNSRWPSMELKGDGGYVIVIGQDIVSAHAGMETVVGNYEILDGTPISAEDLDQELYEFVFQPKESDSDFAVARSVAEALEMAKAGRNNAGFWLARQLRDLGLEKADAWVILEGNFYPEIPRGSHQFTKKELRDSLDSAFSKTPDKLTVSQEALALVNNYPNIELWHSNNEEDVGPFVTVDGENIVIGSIKTREFISALYFRKYKKPLNKSAQEEVIDTLKWAANIDGKGYDLHYRVAYKDEKVFVDAPSIQANVQDIKFYHDKNMGTLPEPDRSGTLEPLRKYLNIRDEDWPLAQGIVLSHFMPDGPYPVGVFIGPQGSAKSTNQSIIQSVLDPKKSIEAGRFRLPSQVTDLVVQAKHNWIMSFDNISGLTEAFSDAFCTFSTGGNISRRKLYTDDDMINYGQRRPILLNGIGDIVTKPDLMDRSIIFECPPLTGYKSEADLYEEFKKDWPQILGAAMNMAERALKHYREVEVDGSVRMADFLRWCVAAGIHDFERAFIENRNRGAEIAIENSSVGRFVRDIAIKYHDEPTNPDILENLSLPDSKQHLVYGYWVGPMHKLYEMGELTATGDYDWPKKFESFVNQLKRVEPMLNKLGIVLDKHRTQLNDFVFVGYKDAAKKKDE